MNEDDAQEIGYRKGLIKGRQLQKQEIIEEILADLKYFTEEITLNYLCEECETFMDFYIDEKIKKYEGMKNEL